MGKRYRPILCVIFLSVSTIALLQGRNRTDQGNTGPAEALIESVIIDPTIDPKTSFGSLKLTHPVELKLKDGDVFVKAGTYLRVLAVISGAVTIDYNTHIKVVPVKFTSEEKRKQFYAEVRPIFRFVPAR